MSSASLTAGLFGLFVCLQNITAKNTAPLCFFTFIAVLLCACLGWCCGALWVPFFPIGRTELLTGWWIGGMRLKPGFITSDSKEGSRTCMKKRHPAIWWLISWKY